MKNIKKIKVKDEGKKSADSETRELLMKRGKKAVSGCPEI
jgi:hypothetical protein